MWWSWFGGCSFISNTDWIDQAEIWQVDPFGPGVIDQLQVSTAMISMDFVTDFFDELQQPITLDVCRG